MFMAVFLPNSTVLASITTIFSDDFEDGNYNGWSSSGNVIMEDNPARGSWSVRLKGNGQIWQPVSTVGYSNVTFSWYMAARSLENNDHCYAEINTGSGWTVVGVLSNGQDNRSWYAGSYGPNGADNNPNVQIRFRVIGAAADYCYVDDVAISGESGGGDPTPTPTATATPTPGPTPTPEPTPEPGALKVAVYASNGAESDKILALMRAINAMGHEGLAIGRNDLMQGRITTSNFDVLVVGAGEGENKTAYAASDGLDTLAVKNAIKAFVNSGGGFVGLESGAYFASSNGGTLDLYGGRYRRSATAGKYTFDIVDSTFGSGSQEAYMSGGGGYFDRKPASATVVAKDASNRAVLVRDTYGSGRVILSTFDPELRGDSELDWVIWDNWVMNGNHANSEGAWELLGRMIDWAAGGSAAAPAISASNNSAEKIAIVSTHNSDGGAWSALIPSVARSIEYAGYVPLSIRFEDIMNDRLSTATFAVAVFPGGYSYGYKTGLDGYEYKIRNYASAGGGLYGICAGSFYLTDSIEWEGKNYDYPVDIFSGVDIGPLEDIASWPGYDSTLININDPIIGNLGDQYQMYYGGGYKTLPAGVSTVATYQYGGIYNGTPDAIRFTYGNGRVLLVGTHPEARSGSNVDWTYWDNWVEGSNTPLNNPDNPWTFVDAVFDNWLIQQ
jgi:glutamine amidotransferase-like uncharacterized protein